MGSILIRKVPDAVHRKFKQACRARKISMEEAIVRLLAREVGEGRPGRPRAGGAKRRSATVKRGRRKGTKGGRKAVRKIPRKTVRRPARARRRRASARAKRTRT